MTAGARTRLVTVGHGALATAELVGALAGAGVDALVDIRRFPASRAHPHLSAGALAASLPAEGVDYRSEPRLGGRRRLAAGTTSPDTWWTVEAFRAYAAWTRTAEFGAGLSELLDQARTASVAVMCSETVWWRCHRRLVADVAALARGTDVCHLLPPGPLREHPISAGARLAEDGTLVWDLGGRHPDERPLSTVARGKCRPPAQDASDAVAAPGQERQVDGRPAERSGQA